MTRCTVCGDTLAGAPDDDRCCADCDAANFPPPEHYVPPQGWWMTARGPLAPRRDGVRVLIGTVPWGWNPEETPDGPSTT